MSLPRHARRSTLPAHRPTRAPALAVVVLALLGALLTVATAGVADAGSAGARAQAGERTRAQAARDDGPGYGRPRVGACHDLTYARAGERSDSRDPIGCRRTHRSQTITAPIITANVNWSDDEAVSRYAAQACTPAFRHALGSDPRTRFSAFSYVYFQPSSAQLVHGASWIRCDVVLRGGHKLMPLPRRLTHLPRAPFRDAIAACLTKPDPSTRTVCARKHRYRAVATATAGVDRFPSPAKWSRIAARHCTKPAGRHYYATWPSRVGFEWAGERTITCFRPTRA